MSKSVIHLYDPQTGAYQKTFNSLSDLEREMNMYRGACKDALNRKAPGGKLLVSYAKYDYHPNFTESAEVVEPIKVGIPNVPKINLLTEDELRKKHDMFYMVYSYVKSIPDGKYIEEGSLLRDIGLVGKPRYRDALNRPEVKDYRGKVDGVVYYGSLNSIKKLKQEGVLQ